MSDAQARYAFDDCGAWPLPDNRVLVRNSRSGRHAILTPDVHAALTTCQSFHTLEDHAARIARTFPSLQGQEAAVKQVLESVRDDGLLISAEIYTLTLQPSANPKINVDKPIAAIITWERPDALARNLASLKANVDLDNLARLVVVDDSRTPEVQAQNRTTVEEFASTIALPVLFLGVPEQKGFLEAIVRQIPQLEEQIRFLIDRERWADDWTSGLARTLALLVSVGHRLLVLDDDILCEVIEPERAPGVAFGDTARHADFYLDNSDWESRAATLGTDPFLRHLSVLGSELGDALGALGVNGLEAGNFDAAAFEVLERLSPQSRVLITECGSVGDAGTSNLNWLASLEGESLQRLVNDEAVLAHALRLRNAWHGRRVTHVLPRSNMSQLTGLDNRVLLPPYIPILRGEDRLFGDMVEFIHPSSVVVDQSWSVPHLPMPPRQWSEEERRYDTAQPFPRFATTLVEDNQDASHAREPVPRLSRLARLYEDLADHTHEELVRKHEAGRLGAKAKAYRELRDALDATPGAPAEWHAFLQEGLSRLNHELVDNPADAPLKGYPEGLAGEELSAWWQEFWRGFGKALRSWPAIRLAASRVEI